MRITINRQCKTPYFRQITNQMKAMILRGEIPDGTVLPSERAMAKLCDVHRNTVIKAYHELKADGFIVSRQGKGYVAVYGHLEETRNSEPMNWTCLIDSQVQDMDTTFDMLLSRSSQDNIISFVGGLVPPEIYSEEIADRILTILSQRWTAKPLLDDVSSYAPYQGMLELRQELALFFTGKGINVNPRQIQVVADGAQALDYLAEMLLKKGDTVLMEEPLPPDLFRLFSLKGMQVLTVPTDENGIVVESLEPLLQKNRPRLMYVNSSYQDPSGVVTSLPRRLELLKLCRRYGIPIVEDDAASGLYFGEKPVSSYMSLDRSDTVIYIYSFAMTFAPGVRIACVVAPRVVVENMSKIAAVHMTCFNSLPQLILYESLETGIYQESLKRMRLLYRQKRDLMYQLLEPVLQMGGKCNLPDGGSFMWLRLPDDTVRLEKLRRCAERKGLLFIPGFLFFPYGTGGEQYIRLNYSFPTLEQIERGIPLLIEAIQEVRERDCDCPEGVDA